MSATNRKQGVKSLNEFYRTPEYATAALLRFFPELEKHASGKWLEHSAGDGAIIKAVENFGYHPDWTAVELRNEMKPLLLNATIDRSADVITGNPFQWFPDLRPDAYFDVSLGNPPFSQAVEFTEICWPICDITIMLQRLTWLGPKDRLSFFKYRPPFIGVISPRPFPDATEYAWFCWGVGTPGTWDFIA